MSHTTGPWSYEMDRVSNYARLFMRTGDGDVMRGYVGEENAKLIAAAPDLLSACMAFVEYARISGNGLAIADLAAAAIEKATGEKP